MCYLLCVLFRETFTDKFLNLLAKYLLKVLPKNVITLEISKMVSWVFFYKLQAMTLCLVFPVGANALKNVLLKY